MSKHNWKYLDPTETTYKTKARVGRDGTMEIVYDAVPSNGGDGRHGVYLSRSEVDKLREVLAESERGRETG